MGHEFRNKTAIVGLGMSEISRSSSCGAGAMVADAIRSAVADAGLKISDIDGMATYAGGFEYGHISQAIDGIDTSSTLYTVGILGMKSLNWVAEVLGGGPALSPLSAALHAVYTGQCKYAIVYRCLYRPKGRLFGIREEQMARGNEQFLLPYGYGNMIQFAASALNRYFYDYGLKKEHLGEYVIHSRKQAMLNEHAIVKKEISMEEYLSSPYLVEPISKLDCDVPLDGALAVVVTTADRARYLKQKPVFVSAIQNAVGPEPSWGFYSIPEYNEMSSYFACKDLWKNAGFGKEDLGFVQLYDGFSFLPFLWAAHLGLCKPDEMGDYLVEACRQGKKAEIPVTTNGGCLCEGRLHGMGHLMESVLQLQGRAEHRQLHNVHTGVAAIGGFHSCGVIALQNNE